MLCEAYEKAFHFNLSFFLISVVFTVQSLLMAPYVTEI